MKRLLGVHNDERAFEPLRRALLESHRDWELVVVADAEAALRQLAGRPADAVLVAHVPPTLDATRVLQIVRERHSDAVRLMFAAPGDAAGVAAAQSHAQRTLPMDATPALILETLRQTLTLRALVATPGLRQVLGRIGGLPALPRVYASLTRRLESGDTSIEEIAELLEEDEGLAARVLKLANSAYFGRDQAVTRLSAAAARLGTRLLKGLVLTAEVDEGFGAAAAAGFDREGYQRHVTLVARIASSLEPRAQWKDDAFTGGLLHDIGKRVLVARLPDVARACAAQAAREGRPIHEVETEKLGVHHGALGAYLLGLWGLPSSLVESTARHHDLDLADIGPLDVPTAVALANQLAHHLSGADVLPVATADGTRDMDPRWEWWVAMADQLAHQGLAAA